jgi:hypothetical protein
MQKRIITLEERRAEVAEAWLDLSDCAVEITSEDPPYAIESALLPGHVTGWRAAEPGEQTLRILFRQPATLRRIRLVFREERSPRTQEFVLHWLPSGGGAGREIVRQQYHFSPPGTVEETENYRVELEGVAGLELVIVPDIGGGSACASLAELRVA